MIGYVTFGTSSLELVARFYDALLGPDAVMAASRGIRGV